MCRNFRRRPLGRLVLPWLLLMGGTGLAGPGEPMKRVELPALKPVRSEFSAGSPYASWSLDVRLTDLGEMLRRGGISVGTVVGIEVVERSQSLRVAELVIRGAAGSARMRGADFRRLVGYDALKSTLFAVAVDDHYARFSGRGWGHGVGMCQWGAKGMAEQGYTAARSSRTTTRARPWPPWTLRDDRRAGLRGRPGRQSRLTGRGRAGPGLLH